MAKVGLSNFHYAVLTQDNTAGAQYSAPVKIAGAIEVSIKPSSNSTTLYADNGAFETDSAIGEIAVTVQLADLSLEAQAALLGHTVAAGIMECKADDVAPYVAIGFEGLKSNGKKRFLWLYKGKFSEPEDAYKTKGENVEFQPQSVEFKALIRAYDGKWEKKADEDAAGFLPATATGWYNVTAINSGSVAP